MRHYSPYVPAAYRRSPFAAAHGWYAALALGALALGLAAKHWSKPPRRVDGVPDWVYRAFAPQASGPPVSP
jgi:hypothetical protein